MPGRQYSGPPTAAQKPKSKKSKAKRSLDALAIAEKSAPAQKGKRSYRLGQLEEDYSAPKRKRADDDDDDGSSDGGEAKRSRRRKVDQDDEDEDVEVGSDSSGNEWVTGRVEEDDDSELDSDEAFGESDEERFEGYTFRGGASGGDEMGDVKSSVTHGGSRQRKNNSSRDDTGDEEDEADNDGGETAEDFGEDGVDLADVLDEGSGDGSEDDEQDSDAESVLSLSDEDAEKDDSKLASLKGFVDSIQDKPEAPPSSQRQPDAMESLPPSEYGVTSRRKLTAADIMSTITDPALRKSIKHLVDDGTSSKTQRKDAPRKLEAPLPKRQQDRLDRKAAYDKSKETLDRWVDTVKHNRRAEHLEFPLKDLDGVIPQGQNRLLPLAESKPLYELESTIQKIMQESGMVGADGKLSESQIQAAEELKTNKMPIQEVLARRAELRRQRDLLFREEIRAKRIKKIKSKAYRKIHRKEKERNAAHIRSALEADGEVDSESEKERNDRRRAEERMGAKHRDSKWAKGVKSSGRSKWDDDAKEGVLEMARRDEELRRRMAGKSVHGEDDSGSYDDDSEGSDEEENALAGNAKLPGRVQRLLNARDEKDQSKSKLSEMAFMKKAEAGQREENDADLSRLQRDANGQESDSESEASESAGRMAFGPKRAEPPMARPAKAATPKSEFEEPEHSEDESRPQSKRRGEVDIDRVTIDVGHSHIESKAAPAQNGLAKVQTSSGSWNSPSSTKGSVRTAPSAPVRSALKGSRAAEAERNGKPSTSDPAPPPHTTKATAARPDDGEDDSDSEDAEPVVMTNAALARRAFAGDDVLAQTFQEEKAELTREQDDQVLDTTLPGWGAWTGLGVSKRASQPRARHRTAQRVAGVPAASRQDAKLKDVIISEKRVKKNGKYLATQLPHPFETRAQYERSLRLPVGPEWTTKETFQGMTKPRVLVKQGIIAPMVKPMV